MNPPDPGMGNTPSDPAPRRRVSYTLGNRHSSATLRWILVPTAVLVIAGLFVLIGGPRLYRKVRSMRAAHMAASSREAWERGEWDAAWRNLQLALSLDRAQPDAARLAAELLGRFGNPAALDHWEVVTRQGTATKADHLAHFDAALALSRTDVATRVLKDLSGRLPDDAAVTERRIALALRTGRHAEVAAMCRAALERDPANPRWELGLGEALIRSATPREASEGRRILMSVALGHGPHQVAAAELLTSNGRLANAESHALLRALDGSLSPDPTQLRLAARLRLGAATRPDERERIMGETVKAGSPLDPMGRVLLGEFALEAGFPAAARELVPDSLARTFAPAASVHLLALATDPSTAEALRALASGTNSPLSMALANAAEAVLASRQGDKPRSLNLLAQAVADGLRSRDPATDLLTVGRMAEGLGEREAAIAAYEALLEYPSTVPAAARALGRLLPANGDYPRRFRLMTRLHGFMPGSQEVATEYAYLALLMGGNAQEATAVFRALHDANPQDRTARTGLAMALGLAGEGERALEMVEAGQFNFETLGVRERFIQVLCLAIARQRAAAVSLSGRIPMQSLQPEERSLLARYMELQ